MPARKDGVASGDGASVLAIFVTRREGDKERIEVPLTAGSDEGDNDDDDNDDNDEDDEDDDDEDDFVGFASNSITSSAKARRTRARCAPK